MIKVKDLSNEFQNIYIKYKKSVERSIEKEKTTFEKTNDFLLEKSKKLLSKMTTEEVILNNHNKIKKTQNKTSLDASIDYQMEKFYSLGNISKNQRKLHDMMLPESLIIPEEFIIKENDLNPTNEISKALEDNTIKANNELIINDPNLIIEKRKSQLEEIKPNEVEAKKYIKRSIN